MSESEGRRVGGFLIVREIGRGGMAAVYLARQIDLDRDVALKELSSFHAADEAFAARFVRESRVAGSMTHPNIVTVYDFLEQDGTPFIAMEYLERGSLRPFVGQTTPAQTIGVLEGALAGLAMAERHEVVHRDIKPENLMVTGDGEIKIADFGIAKALTEVGGPNLTMTGMTIGTPAYMAPEQATAAEVGPWTDLYSLGVVAYEMALGRVPFHDSDTPVAVLLRQVNEDIPSAITVDPEVDRRFSDWIDRLLVKDPLARTRSAREAWYELEEIAVAMLGPLWRREARLLVAGADRAAGPLTPAPFARDTPPASEAQEPAYATYLGESTAAAAVPPPPEQAETLSPVDAVPVAASPPPADTIPGQPPPPAAPAPDDPNATLAPPARGAPPTSNETFEWPSAAGGRRRWVLLGACILALIAAAGVVFWISGRGSGSGSGSTQGTSTSTKPKAPTAVAQPAKFVQGFLSFVSSLNDEPWALAGGTQKRIVNLTDPSTNAVPVSKHAWTLAAGDGQLWLEYEFGASGEVQRVEPGTSKPLTKLFSFQGKPAGEAPLIANGAIWVPTQGGLLRISEQGGSTVQVKGIDFQPYSLAFAGGSIWASDGKGQIAEVAVNSPQPAATVVQLAGAGWITGTPTSLYAISANGVTKIDPSDPTKQTPVPGISSPPTRIGVSGDVLWATNVPAPASSSTSVTGTLVGLNVSHPGVESKPVKFTAPAGNHSKLEPVINNEIWLTVVKGGQQGMEPFKLTG